MAATKVLEKEPIIAAVKNATKQAFSQPLKAPQNFAASVLLRTFATLSCAILFSSNTKQFTDKIVKEMFGVPLDESTEKAISASVGEILADKDRVREIEDSLDPAMVFTIHDVAKRVASRQKGPFAHLLSPHVAALPVQSFDPLVTSSAQAALLDRVIERGKAREERVKEKAKDTPTVRPSLPFSPESAANFPFLPSSMVRKKYGGKFANLPPDVPCK
jgi:hypothetical protein